MYNPNSLGFAKGQHDHIELRPDEIAQWDQLQAELQSDAEDLDQVRLLTEVDHLNRYRHPDGTHSEYAKGELLVNLTAATQEATQQYAVTPTYREQSGGEYYWMGQTTAETAESGAKWYKSAAALLRWTVEVDEAHDKPRPGTTKIFVSPRMTREDADLEVAQADHLADDDAVRTSSLDIDGNEIRGMHLESLLIRDIPLSAWIEMANDPNGLFQGKVTVPYVDSALPIMRAHREMHVPSDLLPEGPVSVVAAVLPYIKDSQLYAKVADHLHMFRTLNQRDAYQQAEAVALRWRAFEIELADSLYNNIATPGVLEFIASVRDYLSPETNKLLAEHIDAETGTLGMTRTLAASLEAARRNTLWGSAAVLAGDEGVLAQLPEADAKRVREIGIILQLGDTSGFNIYQRAVLEAESNRIIARNNISVGRGCPGLSQDIFNQSEEVRSTESNEEQQDRKGTIRCIKCRQYVPKNRVIKKDCWECPKCLHKVDVCTGKTLREGIIFGPPPEMVQRILMPFAIGNLASRAVKAKKSKEKN